MKIGQTVKQNGEKYTVYKITEFKIFAENEDKTSIICMPNLKIIK